MSGLHLSLNDILLDFCVITKKYHVNRILYWQVVVKRSSYSTIDDFDIFYTLFSHYSISKIEDSLNIYLIGYKSKQTIFLK